MLKKGRQTEILSIAGRYDIVQPPIGQGGMGVVYKAYDKATRRYVAIKTIWDGTNRAALEFFEKEWNVLSQLSHPNIVDIIETGEFFDEGQKKPYFVMPLLPGTTLDELIKNAVQRLTVENTIEIISQACRGLQAAHDQQIIHRDLKPSNIFVMEDNSVKLIDFGIVHLADVGDLTEMKGTLNYLAPELLEHKLPSVQSDIFALAVVCYEALTGRKPFARATESETVQAIRSHIPPAASNVNQAVNKMLDRAVHRAMAKQPFYRFASAREFAETLQRALRNEATDPLEEERIQPRLERIKKAQSDGDFQFAAELLTEVESEGHIGLEISALRLQLDQAMLQQQIRRLLENARARLDQEEYPLAMQKVQEILDIDPGQMDALRLKAELERHRSERQIDKWYQLVRQHIDNQLFAQARQGVQEILRLQSSDPQAHELLAKIDREEKEAAQLREEKEALYVVALRCHQGGEISTALHKLERLLELSRRSSRTESPEKEAHYQSLYDQIRSEREVLRNAYLEARRHLENKAYDRASAICTEFIKKSPADPLFHALKLEIEERQRQERSGAVVAVSNRLQQESDLDRKVAILREATERFPDEPYFQETLKHTRERRDLLNSILNRASQYEEQGQFTEALAQWDTLRNIYAQYPALDYEVDRLTHKRDEQLRSERKARSVREIDRWLEDAEYAKAKLAVRSALTEFPEDRELLGLEKLVEQEAKKQAEAARHSRLAAELLAEGEIERAIPELRKAVEIDKRSRRLRAELLTALITQIRATLKTNWRVAQPMIEEARELEPNDPSVLSLATELQDRKKQEFVETCVLETRELQSAGDLAGALAQIKSGLASYPAEAAFVQLQATLLRSMESSAGPEGIAPRSVGQRARRLLPLDADDPEEPVRGDAVAENVAAMPVIARPAVEVAAGRRKKVFGLNLFRRKVPHSKKILLAIAALSIVAVVVALYFSLRTRPIRTIFRANVPGAQITIDGLSVNEDAAWLVPGKAHHVQGQASGYETITEDITVNQPSQPIMLVFKPLAAQAFFSSNLTNGLAFLGDAAPLTLNAGSFSIDKLPVGISSLRISVEGRTLLQASFSIAPDQAISLASPIQADDCSVVVASVLGAQATIFRAEVATAGKHGRKSPEIPSAGTVIQLGSAQQLELNDGRNVVLTPETRPTLFIWLVAKENVSQSQLSSGLLLRSSKAAPDQKPAPSLSTVAIQGGTPGASILIDAAKIGQLDEAGNAVIQGIEPGSHVFALAKDGYETREMTAVLEGGKTFSPANADLTLKQLGSVTFSTTPGSAQLQYHLVGEKELHAAPASGSIALKPGRYEWFAGAQGYEAGSGQFTVTNGQKLRKEITLLKHAAAPGSEFAKPESVELHDGWYQLKTAVPSVELRPSLTSLTLTLTKPQKRLFSHKAIGWSLKSSDGTEVVTYEIDGNKLKRKSKLTPDLEHKVHLATKADSVPYMFHIRTNGGHVLVVDEDAAVLDDFTTLGHDLALGSIVITTESTFKVRIDP